MDSPKKSRAEQKAIFEEVYERALKAQDARGRIEHVLNVAGKNVRLVFAGDRLEKELMPALMHLRVEEIDEVDAVFNVWDSETTGVEMIEMPCDKLHLTHRGDIWGFNDDAYRIGFHWVECSVNLFDRQTRQGIWWVQTANTLPYWTTSSPFRSLFQWWLELNGAQLLHAAAIGTKDGGVLITGKGGVGKSTTSLSAISMGLDFAGDDYVVVSGSPEPRVHSLYSTAKLNPDQMARFPDLAKFVTNADALEREKAIMLLFPDFRSQIVSSLPLRALLTPNFGSGPETSFKAATSEILYRASAFTTMSQLPYSGRYTNEFIQTLVASLPGFEMNLGSDLKGVIRAIEGLLKHTDTELAALVDHASQVATSEAHPLVTVIIPVHNGAKFLADAIKSVLAQNYPSLEIIVVDDGSKDDIERAVAELPVDVRFLQQEQSGPAAARNRGIRDASGEFIAFLDVDDLWPSPNLKLLTKVFQEQPELNVVHGYGQLVEFDENSGSHEFIGNPREGFPYYIGAGLFRRTAFEQVGLFDTELALGEDRDWYHRAEESRIGVLRLEETTLYVRRHTGNMTATSSPQELAALKGIKKRIERMRAFKAHHDLAER